MESQFSFESGLSTLIRDKVRECCFDFEKAASEVRSHYKLKGRDVDLTPPEHNCLVISAAECRARFAADYDSSQPSSPESFVEVANLQRRIQEQSRLSHARVFERVYKSLGITPGDSVLAPNDEVLLAMERRAAERQAEEEAAEIKRKEAEEAAQLRVQRDRLRNRFTEGSLDAEGIDPLGAIKNTAPPDLSSAEWISVPTNFNISDLLNSTEFDEILTDIEKSLENQSDDKTGGESELADVLKYLDECSAMKGARPPVPLPQGRLESTSDAIDGKPLIAEFLTITGAQALCGPPNAFEKASSPSAASPKNHESKKEPPRQDEANYATASTENYISQRSLKGPISGSSSDEDSDVDSDWYRQRMAMKRTVTPAISAADIASWKGNQINRPALGRPADFQDPASSPEVLVGDVSFRSESDVEYDNNGENEVDNGKIIDDDNEIDDGHGYIDVDVTELNDSHNSARSLDSDVVDQVTSTSRNTGIEEFELFNLQDDENQVTSLKHVVLDIDELAVEFSRDVSDSRGGILGTVIRSAPTADSVTGNSCNPNETAPRGGMKHGRRARKESRFANSIATAKTVSKQPEGSNTPVTEGPTQFNYSHTEVGQASIQQENNFFAGEVSVCPSVDDTIGSQPSPVDVMAPCVEPYVHTLYHRYLADPNMSLVDIAMFQSMPMLKFRCSTVCSESDAGIASFLSWFLSFAVHTKVRIIGLQITTDDSHFPDEPRASIKDEGKLVTILLNTFTQTDSFSKKFLNWEEHFSQALHSTSVADLVSRDRVSSPELVPKMFSVPSSTLLCNVATLVSFSTDQAQYLKHLHHMLNFRPSLDTTSWNSLSSILSGYSSGTLSDHLVTCSLKPYVLSDNSGVYSLGVFLRMCEEAGFRLVALRSTYMSRTWVTINPEVANILPSWIDTSFRRSESLEKSEPTVAIIAATFYHSGANAAQIMYDLLGPDDPALARRTDPQSARALLGDPCDRNKNICYPVSSSLDHVKRETLFWISGRTDRTSQGGVPLHLPAVRNTMLGFSVTFPQGTEVMGSKSFKKLLCRTQGILLNFFGTFLKYGFVHDFFRSIDGDSFVNLCGQESDAEEPTSGLSGNTFYWVAGLYSSAGELALDRIRSDICVMESSFLSDLGGNLAAPRLTSFLRSDASIEDMAAASVSTSFAVEPASGVPRRIDDVAVISKIASEECTFLSHENLYLADCIVLVISAADISEFQGGGDAVNLAINIYRNLASKCYDLSIVGMKIHSSASGCDNSSIICFRGWQIIECMDDAVSDAIRTIYVNESKVFGKCGGEEHSHGDEVSNAYRKMIRVLRGKNALDLIMRHFSVVELFTFDATADLYNYVPQCYIDSNPSSKLSLYRALFLPGDYNAVSVLIIPGLDSLGVLERILSRVMKRLEKEGLQLLLIKHFLGRSSDQWNHTLLREAAAEYDLPDTAVSRARSLLSVSSERVSVALLLRGVGIVRRLYSIIGPPCIDDPSVYPRSISSNLASIGVSFAPVFSTLSCRTAASVSAEVFGVKQVEALHLPPIGTGRSDFRLIDTTARITVVARLIDDCHRNLGDGGTTEQASTTTRRTIITPDEEQLPYLTSILPTSYDVTCFIISSSLIEETGLSVIIESLSRENLKIVNSRTLFLDTDIAKRLLSISGHSSLSFHAPLSVLLEGPALCLAIEGPTHAIMKLKSITLDSKILTGGPKQCIWKLRSGDWGVIASSSVRLARELVLFCFRELHGALRISSIDTPN